MLTKECCATITSVIVSPAFEISAETIDSVGDLLIRTLTTIKHAGAAFSARDSLEAISLYCLAERRESIHKLPISWTKFLLNEISECNKVRDSTLRRSTGYALGFLALLRTMRKYANSRSCSDETIQALVHLSFPTTALATSVHGFKKISDDFAAILALQNGADEHNVSDC